MSYKFGMNDNCVNVNVTESGQGSETDYAPVPVVMRRNAPREEEERAPPGPACSKVRPGARSRSGSTSSSVSIASSTSVAMAAERKSRRQLAQEANRMAMAVTLERVRVSPVITVASGSEETEEERGSPVRGDQSRKRKLTAEEGAIDLTDGTQRKQGRPRTTGLYIGRAKAMEASNRKKREGIALDNERILKSMSTGQIFSKVETDLEDAVSEISDAPTADIANRARECMAEVYKVAKGSSNLKGGYVKILKHAAVMGSASTEVLRTRADNNSGSDNGEASRQIKELKKELEVVRREAQQAKEEAAKAKEETETLRKELDKIRGKRGTRERRRLYIRDSSPSPPASPDRGCASDRNEQAEPTAILAAQTELTTGETPMEVEDAAGEETQPPEYCDARRKREILPPPEQWPDAIRPALRGKVKVLVDRPLTGHTVRLVDERKREKKKELSPVDNIADVEKGGAQLLVEQVTPLLQKWLEESLKSMGLPNKPRGRDAVADNAKSRPNASQKANQKTEKPARPQPKGPTGAKKEVVQSTTEPNAALWSGVVGRRADKAALPPPPPTAPKGKPKATGPPNAAADPGAWQVATSKKARKKAAVSEARAKAAEPPDGKTPAREGKSRSVAPPSQGAGTNKAPKRRPPRTAAVTLTCPPDGYAEAMRVAQKAIDLRDLGIKELRPKRAATGAIILEVPGPNGAERASMLKEKMEEALKDMEGVRVARPVKMADLRIKDLLASTTVEEVRGAISSAGGCALHETRAGEIRMAPNGMGTLWVQCPLGAANKAAAAGRLRIGWTSSRVEILEPRRLQCFRCLERGHVQNACPSSLDRSKTCYRCSGEGHAAIFCTNDPHCVLCEGLGLASGHRVGGKACRAPKRNPKFQKAATTAPDDRMEVEIAPPAVRGGPRVNATPVPVRRSEEREESPPAVRGGSLPTGGTPVPVRRGQEGSSRPAVRVRPPLEGAPVPVRPAVSEKEEERMEVETFPESQQQPPKEQRMPRVTKGREEPLGGPSSSPPQG